MKRLDPMGEAMAWITKPVTLRSKILAIFKSEASTLEKPIQSYEAIVRVVDVLMWPTLLVVSETVDAGLADRLLWEHLRADVHYRPLRHQVTGDGVHEEAVLVARGVGEVSPASRASRGEGQAGRQQLVPEARGRAGDQKQRGGHRGHGRGPPLCHK